MKTVSIPLVSTIICTYNRPSLIPRAIQSVLDQTYQNIEIIIVDDNSSNNNKRKIKNLDILKNKKINTIWLNDNMGVAHATNCGFRKSKGDFIALLGDDDYWIDRKKIEKQILHFGKENAKLGLIGTWWFEKDSEGNMISNKPEEPKNWKEKLLGGGGIICGSTPLIKRQAWITAGGLDECMFRGTDSDLFRRIILNGYTGTILTEPTTVVDVGHGHTRMTPAYGLVGVKNHILINIYLLWKYRRQYKNYPRAMQNRIQNLIKIIVKLMFIR